MIGVPVQPPEVVAVAVPEVSRVGIPDPGQAVKVLGQLIVGFVLQGCVQFTVT
jgi:hypothetical protein